MNPNPRWIYSTKEQDKWLDGPYVVIGRPSFYMDNRDAMHGWLDHCTPGWKIRGVVIRFLKRDHQTMFKLRWDDV